MLDLTKQEKIILLFLISTFIAGSAVSIYKKSHRNLGLSVRSHKLRLQREKADRFIEERQFVNINSFEINELVRIPGVGEKIAQRVVEYHRIHGPFKSKKDLRQVKGIGEKKFENIKDLIVLE